MPFSLIQRFFSRREELPLPVGATAIVFLLIIAIFPVGLMLVKSVIVDGAPSLTHYFQVFGEKRVFILLGRSFLMAVGATCISLLLAVPMALFIGRAQFWGNAACRYLCLVPLFIPSHIHTLAWINLIGENSLVTTWLTGVNGTMGSPSIYSEYGVALLLSFSYFPILVLMLLVGLSRIGTRQEESALLSNTRLRVLQNITLPMLQPYLVTGSFLVFVLSFFNYGIPSMLRVNSFPVEIFTRFSAFYDEGGATALSLPVILIAGVLLYAQHHYNQQRSFSSKNSGSNQPERHFFSPVISAIGVGIIITVTVILPLVSLIIQAGDSTSYTTALQTSTTEILTTLFLAMIAATITTLLAYLLAHCIWKNLGRRRKSSEKHLELMGYLPLAFPATFFGIGLIHMWNHSWANFIYSSGAILIIGYIARFIPFSLAILGSGMQQVPSSILETAHLCQPSWLKRLWFIHLPLARRGLLLSWVTVFIFSMGELGTTLLVIPAGMGTISLKIYTLMHYGAGPLVAALALILITINLSVSLCAVGITQFRRT